VTKIEQEKKDEAWLIAKNFLQNQRNETIQIMTDQKVLVEWLPGLLLEDVVPWLYNRVS